MGEGVMWPIGAVVCLHAAPRVNCSLEWAIDKAVTGH